MVHHVLFGLFQVKKVINQTKIITGKNNPHVLPNKKNETCYFFQTFMTFQYTDWLIGILIIGLLK